MFFTNWRSPLRTSSPPRPACSAKLLLVVEGTHDASFLRVISRMLHAADAFFPDLGALERTGELICLPFGGGDVFAWVERLASLGLPELHLYDRETPPETKLRLTAAARVNQRPRCLAYVTRKRSLENYLHPECVREISGLDLAYGADDDVAELVARACHERLGKPPAWQALARRARKRFRERAKKWLNRVAVERMTPALLARQDPCGEIRSWLAAAARLMHDSN